jgi:hypothetical protein
MKTKNYNPSPLEVELANALEQLKDAIGEKLTNSKILDISSNTKADNPQLNIFVQDDDGDRHELVVKIIQRIDNLEH